MKTNPIEGVEMKGTNKVVINTETIREALEYYLNSKVFLHDKVKVDTWRRDKLGHLTVRFTVTEKDK